MDGIRNRLGGRSDTTSTLDVDSGSFGCGLLPAGTLYATPTDNFSAKLRFHAWRDNDGPSAAFGYGIGSEALRKAGYHFDIAFTPHSVGLMHTDEPGHDGAPFLVKDDLVLEENMILSVDCPVRNTGIGGSTHLEDLTLITKDGAEQINDIGDRVIVV